MIGSAFCGTAENITQLGIYRAIQGIGGGALVPIAFTIVLIFSLLKSAENGWFIRSGIWIVSIFGPLLGAYITDYISWHWVFYINLPLGILALIFITFFYKESRVHRKQKLIGLAQLL